MAPRSEYHRSEKGAVGRGCVTSSGAFLAIAAGTRAGAAGVTSIVMVDALRS